MIQIAPSLLSADFLHLEKDILLVNAFADLFHLDVMDGVFVPNISFGFPVVEAVARQAEKPLDVHLMIVHPEKYVERFAALGVQFISVHIEACEDLSSTLSQIRAAGAKAGIAINPETDAALLKPYLKQADFILVMSVHPGFSGQYFIEGSLEKVARVREMIAEAGANCIIEVDGGEGMHNIAALEAAGASDLVAANAAFMAAEP